MKESCFFALTSGLHIFCDTLPHCFLLHLYHNFWFFISLFFFSLKRLFIHYVMSQNMLFVLFVIVWLIDWYADLWNAVKKECNIDKKDVMLSKKCVAWSCPLFHFWCIHLLLWKSTLYCLERYVWKILFFPPMAWNANICNNSNMIINRWIINLKRLIDYEMQVWWQLKLSIIASGKKRM